MTTVPVLLENGHDLLDIRARLLRGFGDVHITGSISEEIEDEFQKALALTYELAELGEFKFPDLSRYDLHLSFACRFSSFPIVGRSYGLGLGIELLRLCSGRNWPADQCYTGGLGERGELLPVAGIKQKFECATESGFRRIFIPSSQLDWSNTKISQVPVETLFQAWGVLNYEKAEA